MKRIRIWRLCVPAVLAVGAIACTPASAAEYEVHALPEIGRCVKVATGTGAYSGASCLTLAAPGRGKYSWTQVNVAEQFKFAGSGLETVLATPGHPTIKCVTANIKGEWTGPKTATVNVELQGCVNSLGQQCQSNPQNKSEISTLPLEGVLGFIKNELKEGKLIVVVGLDLKPPTPLTDLAIYECGSVTETAHIEGSVIGKIKPINKMTLESNLVYYVRKNGEQLPEKFQGEPQDTLTTTFDKGLLESESAPTTLNIKSYLGKNSSALEIKAKGS